MSLATVESIVLAVTAEPTRASRTIVTMTKPHVCAPIDANGNLTSDGTKTFHWNALNQLVEVKEGTTTRATFEYDGFGRRTEKVAAGLTHQYIYDAEDIVEERISGSGGDTIRYYHGTGIDEPLARKNSSDVVTYYLADHLGSIVQETSASGAVTLEREYDPWGVPIQGGATSGSSFTGREWDAEIGLSYYRARYYAPERGKFMSNDPAGLIDGPNLFAYVDNAPLEFVDPSGLCSEQPETDDDGKERKQKDVAKCFENNRLANALPRLLNAEQSNLGPAIEIAQMVSGGSLVADFGAMMVKGGGALGTKNPYASGLNWAGRTVAKTTGSKGLHQLVNTYGGAVTGALATVGVATGVYDATTLALCLTGGIQ